MRHWPWLTIAAAVSLLFAVSAHAQEAGSPDAGGSETPASQGIGYPSVAAALADLRARGDVAISDKDGWTIVEDRAAGTFWSFTPPDHPAYPAAVKRMITERDGEVFIETRTLCQAEKAACDKLVDEFTELNKEIVESARKEPETSRDQWTPSARQKSRAEETRSRFLQATDDGRYQDAYGLFTSGMKSLMTFERFVSHEETFRTMAGGDPARSDIRVTWYKDPPGAAAPGVYAAFDITCRFRNIDLCKEVLILHEQENGEFLMMRHERDFVDKDTEARLREQQRQRKNP